VKRTPFLAMQVVPFVLVGAWTASASASREPAERPVSFADLGALASFVVPRPRKKSPPPPDPIDVPEQPRPEPPERGAPPWERSRFALDREREEIANAPLGAEPEPER
jgi:hypothetical protein